MKYLFSILLLASVLFLAGCRHINDITKVPVPLTTAEAEQGIQTTKAVYEFSKKNNLYMPLTEQVYGVLYENKDLNGAISDLIKIE